MGRPLGQGWPCPCCPYPAGRELPPVPSAWVTQTVSMQGSSQANAGRPSTSGRNRAAAGAGTVPQPPTSPGQAEETSGSASLSPLPTPAFRKKASRSPWHRSPSHVTAWSSCGKPTCPSAKAPPPRAQGWQGGTVVITHGAVGSQGCKREEWHPATLGTLEATEDAWGEAWDKMEPAQCPAHAGDCPQV